MGSWLANFASWLREVFPEPLDPWFGERWSSPLPGSRYRVRKRLIATVVTLPLDAATRRHPVSLPPTTVFVIHAATRSNDANVFATTPGVDATELLSAGERIGIGPAGYLVEIPRRLLAAQCVRC
jgi:hypothetical protein